MFAALDMIIVVNYSDKPRKNTMINIVQQRKVTKTLILV